MLLISKELENRKTARVNNIKKALIIGMGYIALEMCEALRDNDIIVEMIKPREIFLPWMNTELAKLVQDEVAGNGVCLHMGHNVRQIEAKNHFLKIYCSDLELEAQMILIATGVKPNSQIAQKAGLELGPKNSISVNKTLVTSDKDVYAAGDCADAIHVVTGEKVWIPLALRANRAGWAVADNITGKNKKLDGIVGTAVFKVFDMQVARTGLSFAEAQKAGFNPVNALINSRSRAHAHRRAATRHRRSRINWRDTDRRTPENRARFTPGPCRGQTGRTHRRRV